MCMPAGPLDVRHFQCLPHGYLGLTLLRISWNFSIVAHAHVSSAVFCFCVTEVNQDAMETQLQKHMQPPTAMASDSALGTTNLHDKQLAALPQTNAQGFAGKNAETVTMWVGLLARMLILSDDE